MNTTPQNKAAFPFPPALMAIDFVALICAGLSLAELTQESGKALGLIPADLALPVFAVSVVVAAICAYLQIRILLERNKTARGINDPASK
ncbi:MAG: hypothetical protein KJ795_11480 [Gammaproteobacteria bacterium]|nr:hypothetical protein [Gammaproteobacteria bacterium]MBU1775242.1 hypothetical protein [Gammaproteobacteria bacterium]MBU1968641.1 hypothetical protein [Gammaproteobacteria bacterium]